MAYVPHVDDIPSEGYKPSIDDIPSDFNPSFGEKLAPNILSGLAQLGHQLINAPHNVVNAISPDLASHIPTQPNYDFSGALKLPGTTADKVVQSLAKNSPSLAMGQMPLGAAGNAIRSIPGVGNVAANAIGRILPQAAFGAVTNDDPAQGAKNMAEMQGTAEALPLSFKALGKAADYVQPDKYAQKILDSVGGGLNIGENARNLAGKIQNAYNTASTKGKELYDDVFNSGDTIYNNFVRDALKKGKFSNLSPKVTDSFTPDLKDLLDNLESRSTLQNAHELQSQLGFEIRRMQKMDKRGSLSIADRSTLQNYQKARNSLLGDMDKGFDKVDPSLKDKYQDATDHWNENVVPYLANPKIAAIVKTKPEKLTAKQVNNLGNEFKNPDEDMTKIASDVGPSVNNHILFDKLGKMSGNVDSEKLASEINKLKNEGFGDYIHPEIDSLLNKLGNRSKAKTALQAIPGAVGGFSMGSHFGPGGEMIGSALGAPISIMAMKAANALWPKTSLHGGVKNALIHSYQPLARGIQIGSDAGSSK